MPKLIKDKKAVLGLDVVKAVIIALLTLSVITVAVFLALTSLQNANLFTAGTQAYNDTNSVIGNTTTGTVSFFKQLPTIFVILGVVVIIGAIALIIAYVVRFSGGAGERGL